MFQASADTEGLSIVNSVAVLTSRFSFQQLMQFLDTRSKHQWAECVNKLSWILPRLEGEKSDACDWLWPDAGDWRELERVHVRLAHSLYQSAAVGEFHGREDTGYSHDDFPDVAAKAAASMMTMCAVLKHLSSVSHENNKCKTSAYNKSIHALTIKSVLLCAEHGSMESPWVSEESHSYSKDLISAILKCHHFKNLQQFLCGQGEVECGFFKHIYSEIQPKLTNTTWKQNPAAKDVFFLCLSHIVSPHTSKHIDR